MTQHNKYHKDDLCSRLSSVCQHSVVLRCLYQEEGRLQSLPYHQEKRCFQPSWLNDYHWLTYDRERDLMFCSVCKDFKHLLTIKLVQGSDNFRKNLLDAHQKSQSHSCLWMQYKLVQNGTEVKWHNK